MPIDLSGPPETISVAEFAAAMGVGLVQAYRSVHAGEIRSFRIGRRILIPKAAVRELLDGVGKKD